MIVQVHSQGILVDLRAASGGIWVRVGLKVSLLLNEKFQRDIESVAEAEVIRAGAYWRIPGVRRRFESLPEAEDMWRYLFGPSNRVPDFSEVPLTVESPKKLSPKLTQWERLLTDASE